MGRIMLKSKIHRATVTRSDLDYMGSIEIDKNLMEAADILPNEQVHVWNVSNGQRFVTYAVTAPPGSGVVCINGAAARLAAVGDVVIIASFLEVEEEKARAWQPKIVIVNERNQTLAGMPTAAGIAR